MKADEIIEAVKSGKTVCLKSDNYQVVKVNDGFYIKCMSNGHMVGLTWEDGTGMNGKESDFYIRLDKLATHKEREEMTEALVEYDISVIHQSLAFNDTVFLRNVLIGGEEFKQYGNMTLDELDTEYKKMIEEEEECLQ